MIQAVFDDPPDLIPQAILALSIYDVLAHWGKPTESEDDLDYYVGQSFLLDNVVWFSIRHYRGHPKGTSTLYLPQNIQSIERITLLVHTILLEMHISESEIGWQRKDDADL